MKTLYTSIFIVCCSTCFSQDVLVKEVQKENNIHNGIIVKQADASMVLDQTPDSLLKRNNLTCIQADESMILKDTPLHLRKKVGIPIIQADPSMIIQETPE
jgi:hypothetical protein